MFARLIGRPLVVALIAAGFFLAGSSEGQGPELIPLSYKNEFKETTAKRKQLITGERQPGKEDQKVIEVTARWYVQRVTWKPFLDSNPAEMAELHKELERDLVGLILFHNNAKANNGAFVELLGKQLAKSLKEVLARDFTDERNRAANLNAALMLPTIARLKQEDVGDLLVELLKDPKQHDAVKVYAAKAMREFFPARIVKNDDDPKDAKVNIKFKRDSERLAALVEYINRKGPASPGAGEREVARYLRREGIISLAHVGVPALSALKKKGVVEGPAAYELLRVLVKGNGALQPPPSLSERVEAALGLCQLKDPGADIDYDASVAVFGVGLIFLDYASEYSTDYLNFYNRKPDAKKPPPENSKIPTIPWRIQSERFKLGIRDLVDNTTKGTPAHISARKLEKEINGMADAMRLYKKVEADDLSQFGKLVQTLAPKTGQLYKLKGPQIDPESLQRGAAAE